MKSCLNEMRTLVYSFHTFSQIFAEDGTAKAVIKYRNTKKGFEKFIPCILFAIYVMGSNISSNKAFQSLTRRCIRHNVHTIQKNYVVLAVCAQV